MAEALERAPDLEIGPYDDPFMTEPYPGVCIDAPPA